MKKTKMKKLAAIPAVALMTFASSVGAGGGNPSVDLEQTVGTDMMSCAPTNFVTINFGESVNFCYTITNDGDEPFELHSLSTSGFGDLFQNLPQFLGPSDSVSVQDPRTLSSDLVNEATWFATQAPGPYTFGQVNNPGAFIDISGSGTPLGLGDEGNVGVTMPFSFNYFGIDSDEITVGSNGAAIFGTLVGDVDFTPLTLPTPDTAIIAPFWDDFDIASQTGSNQYQETIGVAPNREFIVQWDDVGRWQGTDGENVTFQLSLFEGSNVIEFRYQDVVFGGGAAGSDFGGTATVGIDSGDGTTAVEYSFQGSTPLADGDVVTFLPPAPSSIFASDTSSAAVSVLIPQLDLAPGSITTQVDSGLTGSEVLTIENTGTGLLEWSTSEADAPASISRPPSNFMPTPQADASAAADYAPAGKAATFEQQVRGGGSLAYAYDVRNGFFGTFDHTNPGAFNGILATATEVPFAGDFINDDFSTLYIINSGGDNNLYTINTADGTPTLVGGPVLPTQDPVNEGWSGMTEDPSDGTVYVSTTTGTQSFLYTIDLTTAAVTFVGEVTNSTLLIDIASSVTGELYGFDIGSDSLLAIDKTTGAGTVIGGVGFDANFAQGMDFDNSTNTLYIAAYLGGGANEVLEIDLNTGVGTSVGSVNPNTGGAEIDAFGIAAPTEPCFLANDIPWMSLATTSGTVGGDDAEDIDVNFDSAGLADGIYEADICVFTNDPGQPLTKVPVSLQVGPDDLIFTDGFDDVLPPPSP